MRRRCLRAAVQRSGHPAGVDQGHQVDFALIDGGGGRLRAGAAQQAALFVLQVELSQLGLPGGGLVVILDRCHRYCGGLPGLNRGRGR